MTEIGKYGHCRFGAVERGEPSTIKDGIQERIELSGRSSNHVQSRQEGIHKGKKQDGDDNAPCPGIVNINICSPICFPASAAFSSPLPAGQQCPERMPRLCDPFGIASRQASGQWMSCGIVLCSCSSRYYRHRSFRHLGLNRLSPRAKVISSSGLIEILDPIRPE